MFRATSSSRRPSPRWLIALVLIAMGFQATWKIMTPLPTAQFTDFPSPPSSEVLRLSSLGDPISMAIFWMVWLQTFDDQAGVVVPFHKMNFHHLTRWLERILSLDPRSDYPLFAAIRVYAFVPDPDQQRLILDFVHQAFLDAPKNRWQWLAFATLQARHRLQDPQRARLYMDDLGKTIFDNQLPFWVRGLHARILSEQNELEGAKAVIGGIMVHEPATERQKRALATWIEQLEHYEKNSQ
ncbi:MAG: hypothetical protein HQL93_03595 [Magnetococcales bacterium]|nr:hypothetical protein [Magnetococcales bacterium]